MIPDGEELPVDPPNSPIDDHLLLSDESPATDSYEDLIDGEHGF